MKRRERRNKKEAKGTEFLACVKMANLSLPAKKKNSKFYGQLIESKEEETVDPDARGFIRTKKFGFAQDYSFSRTGIARRSLSFKRSQYNLAAKNQRKGMKTIETRGKVASYTSGTTNLEE